MSTNQPTQRGAEPKPRGANRSTKVAGKLKVLPEQPEPIIPKDALRLEPPVSAPPRRDEGEGSATAGDSEDEDADEEIDTEDVEVRDIIHFRVRVCAETCGWNVGVQQNRSHSCRDSTERRATTHEEEGKVSTSSHGLCYCFVRARQFFTHTA